MPRPSLLLPLLALLLAATLLLPRMGRAEDAPKEDWPARAKEAWQGNCSKCHATPDAKFETDRAFLAQITETS